MRLADPLILARTGWTTGELSADMDAAALSGPYGFVSLPIGVNNQYRGMASDDYRIGFRALPDRAIGLAGGDPRRVLVGSIPDWGSSFYGHGYDTMSIAREIDAFNGAIAGRRNPMGRGMPMLPKFPDRRPATKRNSPPTACIHRAGNTRHGWSARRRNLWDRFRLPG